MHLETFSGFTYSRKVYNVILKVGNTLEEQSNTIQNSLEGMNV